MNVLPLNCIVDFGPANDRLTGTVLGISICTDGVDYKVVWWDGKTRKCEWLTAIEVTPATKKRLTIGFES